MPDVIDELNLNIRRTEEAWKALDFAVSVMGSREAICFIIDHLMCGQGG